MIDLALVNEIYLFSGSTDFRLGTHGLTRKIQVAFSANDLNNTLFVFCSKNKRAIKILEFDSTGVWLYHKKLNNTKLIFPKTGGIASICNEDLKIILNGLDFISKIEGKNDVNYKYF
ncbi:MAG: IS66 family insertion sequence element accessory protein TnpB [Mycoplasmatota bacterium]